MMDEYDISYSKAIFIRNVLRKNSNLTVEELAPLKINEISKLINDKNVDITDIVNHDKNDFVYETTELKQLKKAADDAAKEKVRAALKYEGTLDVLESKQEEDKVTEEEHNAYIKAEQEKVRAEEFAEAARKLYEEAIRERSEGSTTKEEGSSSQNGGTTSTDGTTQETGNLGTNTGSTQRTGGTTTSGGNRR